MLLKSKLNNLNETSSLNFSPSSTGLLDPSTSDGRVIFFLPWQRMTVAGTTDAPVPLTFHPSPSDVDIEFILREIRNYLSKDVSGMNFSNFS